MNNKKNHEAFYPIIITSQHYVRDNHFRYEFPLGSVNFKDSAIALDTISIYYSWYNITAKNNNKSFTLRWPINGNHVFYNVQFDDGFYDVEMINEYIQTFCVSNNLYLINASGEYVYYIQLETNNSYYSVQLNLFEVPSSLPSGWSAPTGFSFPTAPERPLVTIGDSNNFGLLIGFEPGDYNSASKLSTKTPKMSPVQSIIVQCPFLDNKYSNPSSNLYCFNTNNIPFGDIVDTNANELVYVDLTDCSTPHLDIFLVDQSYNQLVFRDTDIVIQLIIKVRS